MGKYSRAGCHKVCCSLGVYATDFAANIKIAIAHAQSEICMCMYAIMKFSLWSNSTQPVGCMKLLALQYGDHFSKKIRFIDFEINIDYILQVAIWAGKSCHC